MAQPGPLAGELHHDVNQARGFLAVFENRIVDDQDFLFVGDLLGREVIRARGEDAAQRMKQEFVRHARKRHRDG